MNRWDIRMRLCDINEYENFNGFITFFTGCDRNMEMICTEWLWNYNIVSDSELKKHRKHCNHREFVTRYSLHEQMGSKGSRVSAEKPYAHRCFKECKKCGLILDTWLE